MYSHLYALGSCTGKFYGTAEVHKITSNDSVDQLLVKTSI